MALEVWRVVPDAHDVPIMCCAYNKGRGELFSGGQDSLVKLWDADTGKLLRVQAGHKGWVSDLLWVGHLQMLFSCSVDGTLVVWSEKGRELQQVEAGTPLFCLSWNAKRKQIVAGGNGQVLLYRVSKLDAAELNPRSRDPLQAANAVDEPKRILKLIHAVRCHTDIVKGVCVSDAGRVFSTGYDKCICMFDSERPKDTLVKYEKCHDGAICSVAFDTDNNWLVTGSYDGTVKIWSQEGRCLDVFEGLSDTVTGICYVGSTKNYWITGKHRKLVAYDPRIPTVVTDFLKETGRFEEFSMQKLYQPPATDVVVGVTTNRQLVIWHHNPAAVFRVINGHQDWIETMCVVQPNEGEPKNIDVFSAGCEGSIFRWQPNNKMNTDLFSCQEELHGHEGTVNKLVYCREINSVISASEDTTIRLWSLDDATQVEAEDLHSEELDVLVGHEGSVNDIVLVKDQVLVSVGHDLTIRFWDLHTKHEIECIENAHSDPIMCIAYCAENDELATCSRGFTVKVWCAIGHSLKYKLVGHARDVTQVVWCGFRGCWISAGDDASIRLWDTKGAQLSEMHFRGDSVTKLFVDEGNSLLTAAMSDRGLRVYDLAETDASTNVAVPIRKYVGHTDLIQDIAIVPGKSQYLTCSWDKSIRVWVQPKVKNEAAVAAAEEVDVVDEDMADDEHFVSEYEKEHPLVPPKSLRKSSRFPIKLSSSKSGLSSGMRSKASSKKYEKELEDAAMSTPLGMKLKELEERLNPYTETKERENARELARRRSGMVSPSMLRNARNSRRKR